jgi:N-acyl-L-homoserine lactone synthetase
MQSLDPRDVVLAKESGFSTLCGLSAANSHSYFKLRAAVFRSELQWIGSPSDETDSDSFDDCAIHFLTLNPEDEVVAALRILPGNQVWMMEKYFGTLLPRNTQLHNADNCEISRLAIDKHYRNYFIQDDITVAELLYKGVFQYCLSNHIRNCFMVTTLPLVHHLRKKGIPVAVIDSQCMESGLMAFSGVLDWYSFIEDNSHHNPKRMSWYLDLQTSTQSQLAS